MFHVVFSLPLLLCSRINVTSVEEKRADIPVFDYLFFVVFDRKERVSSSSCWLGNSVSFA